MKECVVCGKMIKKVDSVMTIDYVCSLECKTERKKSVPPPVSILTVSYWTDKGYSEEQAREKISVEQAKRSPRHPSYWTSRGFTADEATLKVAEVQSNNGKRNAELYTKEERLTRCVWTTEYWISKGYTEDEAKEIITNNADTQSLESYISRYGEEEGTAKYTALCNHRKETYTLEGSIARHGDEKGVEIWANRFSNRIDSKAAKNFFDSVIEAIPTGYNIHVGGDGKKEFGVRNLENNKYYLYDFVIPKLGVCVEFHGDYWHCNPNKYSADFFHPQSNKYASDIWAYDQLKIDTMTKYRGYETTVVWESEAKAKLPEVINMINERYAIVKAESPHLFEEEVSSEEPVS